MPGNVQVNRPVAALYPFPSFKTTLVKMMSWSLTRERSLGLPAWKSTGWCARAPESRV